MNTLSAKFNLVSNTLIDYTTKISFVCSIRPELMLNYVEIGSSTETHALSDMTFRSQQEDIADRHNPVVSRYNKLYPMS